MRFTNTIRSISAGPLTLLRHHYQARRVQRRFPALARSNAPGPSIQEELRSAHEAFTQDDDDIATGTSYELALFLWRLCDTLHPHHILEIGTGFSSYVIRRWASMHFAITTTTLTSSEHSLRATHSFLHFHNLDTSSLSLFTSVHGRPTGPFDLILHSLREPPHTAPSASLLTSTHPPPSALLIIDSPGTTQPLQQPSRGLPRVSFNQFEILTWTKGTAQQRSLLLTDFAPSPDSPARGASHGFTFARPSQLKHVKPHHLSKYVRDRLFRHTPVRLRCGISVRPDRLHPRWRLIVRKRYHELDTDRFITEFLQPGDTCMDVGANIGLLTTIASTRTGPTGAVHSFEIDPDIWPEHLQTLARNNLSNVWPNRIALNDHQGEVTFLKPPNCWGSLMISPISNANGDSSDDAVRRYFGDSAGTRFHRPAIPIDQYVAQQQLSRLDLIKIDVDGPELAILRGATHTLRRFTPALMAEASMFNLDHGSDLSEILDFLHGFGYRVYASERRHDHVRELVDSSQAPIDIHYQRGAIDLFCFIPGVHNDRLNAMWFMQAPANLTPK